MTSYPADIIAALDEADGDTQRGFTFLDYDGNPTYISFHDLRTQAQDVAGRVRALGVQPGDRVALVLPEGEDFVPTFLGVLWAGCVPVPLYPPLSLGKVDTYLDTATAVLTRCTPKALLTADWLLELLEPLRERVAGLDHLVDPRSLPASDGLVPPATPQPEDIAFLQFTSGSTSTPKGVMVTHGSLRANAEAIMGGGLGADSATDRGVSWLPLYHDMGLIGFVIAPLFARVQVTFIPTLAFLKDPTVWLETLHAHRGTITFAPNFAYALATRKSKPEQIAAWDLSSVRVLGCGAEPINPSTLRHFAEALAPTGLRPEALVPCYGMAEATLAITFDSPTAAMHSDRIDAAGYRDAARAEPSTAVDALEVVSCGRAVPGHRLGVIDEAGRLLPDRCVGEVVFAGPSVTAGYWQDPETTSAAFSGGWLRTGDLGYLSDGELYVTGRKKDLLIVNGRNYDPQRIEWCVGDVAGTRRGNAVAITRPGPDSEQLVVVLESRTSGDPTLADRVRRAVASDLQLVVADVVVLAPGQLPKTSSGKLQRHKTRELYLDSALSTSSVPTRAAS